MWALCVHFTCISYGTTRACTSTSQWSLEILRTYAYQLQNMPNVTHYGCPFAHSGLTTCALNMCGANSLVMVDIDSLIHRTVYQYGKADWDGFRDFLNDAPWSYVLSLDPNSASAELNEWKLMPLYHQRNFSTKPIHSRGSPLPVLQQLPIVIITSIFAHPLNLMNLIGFSNWQEIVVRGY